MNTLNMKFVMLASFITMCMLCSCNDQSGSSTGAPSASGENYLEGKDYQLFERVRLLDKIGFTEPQEAYSLLLPQDWQHESDIIWNQPGSSCAGTFRKLKAVSGNGEYVFELFPDILYSWNTDPELMRFYQNNEGGSNCLAGEPIEAEAYLRNEFLSQLGNPQVVRVEPNSSVAEQMRQMNASAMNELRQYGAGQMDFNQTAVNAILKWADGTEGILTLGSTIITTIVPNVYNGTYDKIFTTQITERTLFKYPSGERDQAERMYSVIMSSFHTNPSWNDAVNNFWRQARQQSHTAHIGKIRMMDEQTRRIGEQAIRNGEQRLNDMENQMRNWEQSQNAQDRMHTEFVKTIREVENFRDETGKYEMAAGYDHVWSRGDGNSFILSNNPNFDPSSVFQDQRWKQMRKVR